MAKRLHLAHLLYTIFGIFAVAAAWVFEARYGHSSQSYKKAFISRITVQNQLLLRVVNIWPNFEALGNMRHIMHNNDVFSVFATFKCQRLCFCCVPRIQMCSSVVSLCGVNSVWWGKSRLSQWRRWERGDFLGKGANTVVCTYLYKFWNIFVWILKCIYIDFEIILSEFWNVEFLKHICLKFEV